MNKFLTIVFVLLLMASCGTVKPAKEGAENSENKHVLGPNTPSNKYSKMRQRN